MRILHRGSLEDRTAVARATCCIRRARRFCAGDGCFISKCCASSVDSGEIVAIRTRLLRKFGGAAPVSGRLRGLLFRGFGFGGRFFRSDDHFCVVFVRSRRGSRFCCDGSRGRASAPKSVRLGPKSRSASMGCDILPLLSRGDVRSWCARAAPSRPESARTAALVVTLGRRHAAGRTVCWRHAGRERSGLAEAAPGVLVGGSTSCGLASCTVCGAPASRRPAVVDWSCQSETARQLGLGGSGCPGPLASRRASILIVRTRLGGLRE